MRVPVTWHDAFTVIAGRAAKRQMTNRDAAGLILFARAAQRLLEAHADPLNVAPSMAFDWYRNALLTLGWAKHGDKFVMTDNWQKQPYVDAGQLLAELDSLASMLDAAHVPFKMLRNPQGDAAAYKQLALDAYHLMQRLDPTSADIHGPPMAASKQSASSGAKHKKNKNAVHAVAVDPMPPETPVSTPEPVPGEQHTVQPPPVVIDHPDGGQVSVTSPRVIVPPVVAPPSGGVAANVPGPGVSVPVAVTPPPILVPPLQPGGATVEVQPPPVIASAPVVPHPDDGEPGQPGDWYWRKHTIDDAGLIAPDAPPKIRKGKKPAGSGDAAGILLLLVVLAFSQ